MINFRSKLLLISLIVLLVIACIYFVIFSPITANYKPMISARKAYFAIADNLRVKMGIKYVDNYMYFHSPFRILRVYGDGYLYSFMGRFGGINADTGEMYLRDSSGKIYIFKATGYYYDEVAGLVYFGDSANSDPSSPEKKFYLKVISESPTDFTDSTPYGVLWKDTRNLSQILRDVESANTLPVNRSATDFIDITRFDQ